MLQSEAYKILAILGAAYPARQLPEESAEVYSRALVDIDYHDAERAVYTLICKSKWHPSIAEIRQAVFGAVYEGCSGELAWAEVLREVRRVGSRGVPDFQDKLCAVACAAVGWREICLSDKPGVTRAHFVRAYEAALQQATTGVSVNSLLQAAMVERLPRAHELPEVAKLRSGNLGEVAKEIVESVTGVKGDPQPD